MLVRRAHKPFNDPNVGWCIKADGWRALLCFEQRKVHVWSRHGTDLTDRFPELQSIAAACPGGTVLDGELCVLDENGHSRFDALLSREPATFVAFDVLRVRGRDTVDQALRDRDERLADLLQGKQRAELLYSPMVYDGLSLYAHACALNLEGIVGKRLDEPYRQKSRSGSWVKVYTPFGREMIVHRMQNARRRSQR